MIDNIVVRKHGTSNRWYSCVVRFHNGIPRVDFVLSNDTKRERVIEILLARIDEWL